MNQPPTTRAWLLTFLMLLLWLLVVLSDTAKAADGGWGPMLRKDYAAATTYWGGPPTQCSAVEKRVMGFPEGIGGEATEPYPGYYGPCHLWIAQPLVFEPRVACLIVIHEDGHLHGLGHTTEPDTVMYPSYTGWVPNICKRLWPQGGAA